MKKLILALFSVAMMFGGVALADEATDKKMAKAKKEKMEKAKKADDWKFKGQAVLYYQTFDNWGNGALFDQGPADSDNGKAQAAAGLQVFAENKDIFKGLGAGFELSGLSSLGLEEDIVSSLVQWPSAGSLNGGAITQAYVTYGVEKTNFKYGRQTLPKSLSPFAYSEKFNVFQNTFEGLLVVNTDIEDTVLVYANVAKHNDHSSLSNFSDFHNASGAAHMVTAQNKSIKGATLTGSYYVIPEVVGAAAGLDADVFWLDAKFKVSGVNVALQGGSLSLDGFDDTSAFGAKVTGSIEEYKWKLSYSSVNDGALPVRNIAGSASGKKSVLYTQSALNAGVIQKDADVFNATIGTKLGKGMFTVGYTYGDLGPMAAGPGVEGTYNEFDLMYKGSFNKQTKYFVLFSNVNDDRRPSETQNFLRFWVRYNF